MPNIRYEIFVYAKKDSNHREFNSLQELVNTFGDLNGSIGARWPSDGPVLEFDGPDGDKREDYEPFRTYAAERKSTEPVTFEQLEKLQELLHKEEKHLDVYLAKLVK